MAEKRIALVIGNGAYSKVGGLPNPPNDARLIAQTLRGLDFEVIEHIDTDQKTLKRVVSDFGDRLAFHGAVDNQEVLPFGTMADVRAEVRRCIDALAADGTGYVVAPCHNLQGITPVDNILAMYDEALTHGGR